MVMMLRKYDIFLFFQCEFDEADQFVGGYCWLSGINLNILVDILYVCERNIFIVSVSMCVCVFNACTALAV